MATDNWGLTEAGFYCPTFEEILASKIDSAKTLFGENICTDNNTPLGKFIRLESAYDRKLFEALEQVYYSISPATATGVSLDRAVSFARITRNTAVAAVHKIKIYGTKDHIIEKETLVKSSSGVTFYTITDCRIDGIDAEQPDGKYYALADVQCTEAGAAGNVTDISSLVKADSDVSSIEHVGTITYGANTETDPELYRRYNDIVDGLGTNTKNAIIAELLKVNGVHSAKIIENTNDESLKISDTLTIDPGKYAVIVYANSGLDIEIAEAIFRHRPLGVQQNGNTLGTIMDSAGKPHTVLFSYVKETPVNVDVTYKTNSFFGSNGENDIEKNITNYINSLSIGETLVYSRLYEKIYAVAGIDEVTELKLGTGTKSISIESDGIIRAGTVTVKAAEG